LIKERALISNQNRRKPQTQAHQAATPALEALAPRGNVDVKPDGLDSPRKRRDRRGRRSIQVIIAQDVPALVVSRDATIQDAGNAAPNDPVIITLLLTHFMAEGLLGKEYDLQCITHRLYTSKYLLSRSNLSALPARIYGHGSWHTSSTWTYTSAQTDSS
jgi:uncharacterized protein involved in type VI secretion and phage assembly